MAVGIIPSQTSRRTRRSAAHELELNRATAAFEHGVLSPLYLLNGGAVIAFLTLVGAASADDSSLTIDTGWAVAAVGVWAAGLAAAALATWFGLQAQRGYAIGERSRRLTVERLIASDAVADAASTDVSCEASALWETAGSNQRRFGGLIAASILLFLVGAAAAAVAVA